MAKKVIHRPIGIEEFLPLVGRMFDVDCTPGTVAIKLIGATPGRPSGIPDHLPFTLIFHSTPDTLLVDGMYTMKCGSFGPDIIFVNAIAAPFRAEPGYYYQAAFN
jgi:hypothetical protein